MFYVIFIQTSKFIEGIVLSSFVAGCDRPEEGRRGDVMCEFSGAKLTKRIPQVHSAVSER